MWVTENNGIKLAGKFFIIIVVFTPEKKQGWQNSHFLEEIINCSNRTCC
jgi:hypothetical protein